MLLINTPSIAKAIWKLLQDAMPGLLFSALDGSGAVTKQETIVEDLRIRRQSEKFSFIKWK